MMMLLTIMSAVGEALPQRGLVTATAMLLRIPSAGSGGEEATFGLPQALMVIGLVVLLLVLAGLVIWRVRSTRSK